MTPPQKQKSGHKKERAQTARRPGLAGQGPEALLPGSDRLALQRALADPAMATPAGIVALQRTAGNRAVQRFVVQRQAPEEEEELQLKTVQRQPPEEEEALAMKPVQRVGLEGGPVPKAVESAINRARGGGQHLDGPVREQMSAGMGHDFRGVRVHTDSEADALNQQLSAKAFTTGQDIFFRQGEYNPGSSSGRELIAHELTHVVQQSTGQVSSSSGGMTVRPAGDAFEQEADALAGEATSVRHEAGPQATQDGIQRQDAVKPRQEGDNAWAVSRLVQTQPWEGPADYYYEDEEETIQQKALDTSITSPVQRAASEGEEGSQIELATPSIRQAQVTRDGQSAIQRAYVAVGPLAKKGGKWHEKWYKGAFKGVAKSIDSHPRRHGKFHAHIKFDDPLKTYGVTDIGWGKTGNPRYWYVFDHPNAFTDNTGRKYEKDANHQGLDDAQTYQAAEEVQEAWKGQGYDLLGKNCQHFAAEVVKRAK